MFNNKNEELDIFLIILLLGLLFSNEMLGYTGALFILILQDRYEFLDLIFVIAFIASSDNAIVSTLMFLPALFDLLK